MPKKLRILIILLLFAALISFYSFFRIRSIECESQYSVCNSDLRSKLNSLKVGNISSSKKEIIRFLKNEPVVKKYSIQLKLNGTCLVHIEERTIKYCVSGNGNTFYSDVEGIVIKKSNAIDEKCIVNSQSEYNLGDKLTDNDMFAQQIFSLLRNVSDKGKAIINNGILTVEYKANIKLIFPLEGDSRLLAGKTYYIMSQFDIIKEYIIGKGYKDLSEIDFRFNDPIVRII